PGRCGFWTASSQSCRQLRLHEFRRYDVVGSAGERFLCQEQHRRSDRFYTGVPDVNRYTQHRRCSVRLHRRTATLGAAVGGLDLKIIAAFSNHIQTDLVVRPEIKTAADMKGKRIGVTSIGGTGWMSAMLGLEQVGLNPERDKISLAAFGDQRVISQALETGTIQGASLAGVFCLRLEGSGFDLVGALAKMPF